MGPLEFEPAEFSASRRTFTIEINSMVAIAQKILNKKEAFLTNLEKDEHQAMMDILKIGTSAGGARPKAIIAYNKKR